MSVCLRVTVGSNNTSGVGGGLCCDKGFEVAVGMQWLCCMLCTLCCGGASGLRGELVGVGNGMTAMDDVWCIGTVISGVCMNGRVSLLWLIVVGDGMWSRVGYNPTNSGRSMLLMVRTGYCVVVFGDCMVLCID